MPLPRPAFGLAVAAAFAGGVVFASALDWTRAAGAQSGVAFAAGGGRVDVGAGFARIAEQVTPAVVSRPPDIRKSPLRSVFCNTTKATA